MSQHFAEMTSVRHAFRVQGPKVVLLSPAWPCRLWVFEFRRVIESVFVLVHEWVNFHNFFSLIGRGFV